MAEFTKVHGDFKQVMNFDAPSYTVGALNAITSAVTVQPQGPKLDFFTITGNGSQVLDNISTVFQTVGQLATVHIYEYTNATDDKLAIAIYPTGGWTTTTLGNELANAWVGANVAVAAEALFTN
jgi:hypothetical protein